MSADIRSKFWNTIERNGHEVRSVMFTAELEVDGDLSREERIIISEEVTDALSKAAERVRQCKWDAEIGRSKHAIRSL